MPLGLWNCMWRWGPENGVGGELLDSDGCQSLLFPDGWLLWDCTWSWGPENGEWVGSGADGSENTMPLLASSVVPWWLLVPGFQEWMGTQKMEHPQELEYGATCQDGAQRPQGRLCLWWDSSRTGVAGVGRGLTCYSLMGAYLWDFRLRWDPGNQLITSDRSFLNL